MSQAPQGRQHSAKALLYTILGELVLPAGGSAWTSTLLDAFGLLGITEKNARQALARVADQGMIESRRHGREARWELTPAGRKLLEAGAERIYGFGAAPMAWSGEWLLAHCPVPEAQRSLRHRLRTQLSFEGFGELSASLAVSPHAEREARLRQILDSLGLVQECVVLQCRTASPAADLDLARRAWDLDALAARYRAFSRLHAERPATGPEASFQAVVELVHDWRHFASIDPELPPELLPADWAGAGARSVFHGCHARWARGAVEWFGQRDMARRP
ncbi:MAG: PaaX family transcriptional regulator [Acidimicrobiia bacterium]|nr:PaaX family transcriptional regulator [Acidimicrobiia bacterium]MDH5288577.1 PaaX family transcriptional regulator [Acidimicrobiia bacterium]